MSQLFRNSLQISATVMIELMTDRGDSGTNMTCAMTMRAGKAADASIIRQFSPVIATFVGSLTLRNTRSAAVPKKIPKATEKSGRL